MRKNRTIYSSGGMCITILPRGGVHTRESARVNSFNLFQALIVNIRAAETTDYAAVAALNASGARRGEESRSYDVTESRVVCWNSGRLTTRSVPSHPLSFSLRVRRATLRRSSAHLSSAQFDSAQFNVPFR